MRADDVLAGHRFFWERVGGALRMTGMRFDTADHLDLPGTSGFEFVTGRVDGLDVALGSYMHRGEREEFPWSAVLASVDGLPDEIEVSVDRLGAVVTGRTLRERVSCPHAKDKIVVAPAYKSEVDGLELVAGADLPSFIEQATRPVLCALQGGIRIIDGRHWAGMVTDGNPYPFNRTLKRAIAGNDKALASVGIDIEEMADHVKGVIDTASAIAGQFSATEPLIPPPRSRIKKR